MDRISEMPTSFESVRTQLNKEFPKDKIEGLNTQRVEDYIQQEGLTVKPYIIFKREDLPKVKKIVGGTNLLRSVFNNNECGVYIPEIDMVLVARDKDFEDINGPIYTEGLLIHELAHASSMFQGYVTENHQGFYTPRVGFGLPQNKTNYGWVLEEGWADMLRGEYVNKNASVTEKYAIEDSLRYGPINLNDTIQINSPVGILPIPAKYTYVKPDGAPTCKSSSYAGYALELLCRQNPLLKISLGEGRKSLEGLKKVSNEIDKISPGLYLKLQKSDYSDASFSNALAFVITDVLGHIRKAVKAKGDLKDSWNSIIK